MVVPKFRVWEPYYKKMFANDQIIIWDGNAKSQNLKNSMTIRTVRLFRTKNKKRWRWSDVSR